MNRWKKAILRATLFTDEGVKHGRRSDLGGNATGAATALSDQAAHIGARGKRI
jgi:hypothetical protein